MSVFVSWRGSDRDVKNQLVATLKSALPEEEIWESDEGCKSNAYEEFIRKIRESEVFVVIVSDEAMKPSYVYNEVIEAHQMEMDGRLNMLVFKITDQPYTAAFSAHLNHISDANHVARLSGTDEGYRTLAERVRFLLEKRRSGDPENPYDMFVPEVEGTTVGQGYYVEESRSDVFAEFDAAFERSNVIFAAQINGYGKKCAARQYALSRSEYKNVVFLPFFSGSLREFFTTGIKFTNVSPDVFANAGENEVILRKARFLQKMDKSTLIIVPDLVSDARDDRFVCDALAMAGCRIIFATQSATSFLRQVFPVISVDRMKDEHLKELFFHYYEAHPEEQEELSDVLSDFFDSIDGHTRSVEITATVLSETFGIYAEDLPEILGKIRMDSDNELSGRIFTLISELFDMSAFRESERAILFAASCFAQIPIEEKLLVQMLEQGGCYDAKSLRSLIERGWLTHDRMNRTVSIDGFFAEVCLSKIPIDEELLARCFGAFYETLTDQIFESSVGNISVSMKRLQQFCFVLKMPATAVLFDRAFFSSDEDEFTGEKIGEMKERTEAEISTRISSETLANLLRESLNIVLAILSARENLPHAVGSYLSDVDGNLSLILDELQTADPDPIYMELWKRLIYALQPFNAVAFISAYEQLVDALCEGKENQEDNEILEAQTIYLNLVGDTILMMLQGLPYLALRMCRAWYRMTCSYGVSSYSRANGMYRHYLSALRELRVFDEEFDEIYESAHDMIFLAKKEGLFGEEVKFEDSFLNLIEMYADGLLARGDLEQAIAEIEPAAELCDTVTAQRWFVSLNLSVLNETIRLGETELAKDLLKKLLPQLKQWEEGSAQLDEAFKQGINEVRAYAIALLEEREITDFADGSEEYSDYYRTFAAESMDKRALRRYEEIARSAKERDYSALTHEALLEEVCKLKELAKQGAAPERLMPAAFALVSEAGFRTLGYRHHFVQYMGGAAIVDGKIAEIQNGEGKTYTIIMSAFLHTLYGKHVYIVDWSEYLARRNYAWMRGVLEYLGCKVGLLGEWDSLDVGANLAECDIIYARARYLLFRQMRVETGWEKASLPAFDVMIADEAEELLIAQGYKPHITRGNEQERSFAEPADVVYDVVRLILSRETEEYFTCEDNGTGVTRIQIKQKTYDLFYEYCNACNILSIGWDDVIPQYLRCCLDVMVLKQRDVDYFVVDGTIRGEDRTDGSFFEFSGIYNYFLTKKEGLPADRSRLVETKTYNLYTVRELAELFDQIAGATATASGMQKEFRTFYSLDVVRIPPNVPVRRRDYRPMVFTSREAKEAAILDLIAEKHAAEQPILVITDSIHESARISDALDAWGIPHDLLNAKNEDQGTEVLERAGMLGAVTVTTALANRGVDIRLGGNPATLAETHLLDAGYSADEIKRASAGVQDPDGNLSELRGKYNDLVALYRRQTEEDRAYINERGGLCVIGTTCFDDLRVEQQLRGRCGRQGDNGESHVFFAVSDDGFRKLFGKKYQSVENLLLSLGDDGMDIGESKFMIRAIKTARENLQYLLSQSNEKSILRYRPEARKEFFALVNRVEDGNCSEEHLLREYYAGAKRNIESAMAHLEGRSHQNELITRLARHLNPNAAGVKEKAMPGLLMEALENCRREMQHPERNGLLRKAFVVKLRSAWAEYLHEMQRNEKEIEAFFGDAKKAEKQLRRASKDLLKRLYEDAIHDALLFILK